MPLGGGGKGRALAGHLVTGLAISAGSVAVIPEGRRVIAVRTTTGTTEFHISHDGGTSWNPVYIPTGDAVNSNLTQWIMFDMPASDGVNIGLYSSHNATLDYYYEVDE